MSEIKVNKISPRTACGTTTLGDSGDTFTIPAGVSITNSGTASGFGATGAASWNTTVKTGDFTAVAGEGYFVNTTSGAVNVTLPAGTAGAVVAIKDYAKTFDTNAVTLVQNGSDKIGGSTNNATLETEGLSVTLVFIDSTQGWLVTDDGLQSVASTNPYIVATGGTITEDGNFKVHTFTGPGTFEVTRAALSAANNAVAYMVVGGGGGAGGKNNPGQDYGTGGGGAGGFREGTTAPIVPYTASPIVAPTGITVSAQSYPITVGAGGATMPASAVSSPHFGNPGSQSIFSTITASGGGAGARGGCQPNVGQPGGSGGGGGAGPGPTSGGGTGNVPIVSPIQGKDGGSGTSTADTAAGGGGGATANGASGTASASPRNNAGGAGGAGATTSINGTPTAFAGGGGGGAGYPGCAGGTIVPGAGGSGGGGRGGGPPSNPSPRDVTDGEAGTDNTGGGGGGAGGTGASGSCSGGAGGSGIVVIRYRFQ